jgi:methionyl-tRNA formyltransferase
MGWACRPGVRLVFAGTPQVAVPSLDAILGSNHDLAAVVTRPDAAAGRGRRTTSSPVAARAEEAGVEVLKPPNARDPGFLARLREIGPDCCPVVAYGALVPSAALDVPNHGWVNLHFSLLPAWRGAAPVQHAILHGDEVTGASTFRLEAGLDTGPVYGVLTEAIRADDTAGTLLRRLAVAGADLLLATLDGIEAGQLQAVPQPADGVSLAPRLTVDDARVDWTQPAFAVDRRIRACTPSPGAWTTIGGDRLKLGPVRRIGAADADPQLPFLPPGELLVQRSGVWVGCGDGGVALGDVQPPGKRMMAADAWARGLRDVELRFA